MEAEACAEPAMTHACLVARAQALNITTALSANLLLADAPVAYRHMTQPPVLALSQVRPQPASVHRDLKY